MVNQIKQARIFIIDDTLDTVQLIAIMLAAHGFSNVRSSTEPREALGIVHEYQPDLILLDLMMPELDGFDVLAHLRPLIHGENPVPVLVITGDISLETKQRALSSGAKDFVTKPFDTTEVILRIQNLLEMRFLNFDLQTRSQLLEEKVREAMQSRYEAETTLKALHISQQQLQLLSQQLITVQEAERRFIAQELHDEIGQALTSVKINMQAAQQQSQRGLDDTAVFTQHLQEGIEIINCAHEQVRDLSLSLRPSMLDDFGLSQTLEWYVDRQTRWTDITPCLNIQSLDQRAPSPLETACFRVAQEAVSNVLRHAHARKLEVEFRHLGDKLQLVIRDDGVGFDVQNARQDAIGGASMGLLSMEERVRLLGGHFFVKSSLGKGTEVSAHFPLEATRASVTEASAASAEAVEAVEASVNSINSNHSIDLPAVNEQIRELIEPYRDKYV